MVLPFSSSSLFPITYVRTFYRGFCLSLYCCCCCCCISFSGSTASASSMPLSGNFKFYYSHPPHSLPFLSVSLSLCLSVALTSSPGLELLLDTHTISRRFPSNFLAVFAPAEFFSLSLSASYPTLLLLLLLASFVQFHHHRGRRHRRNTTSISLSLVSPAPLPPRGVCVC